VSNPASTGRKKRHAPLVSRNRTIQIMPHSIGDTADSSMSTKNKTPMPKQTKIMRTPATSIASKQSQELLWAGGREGSSRHHSKESPLLAKKILRSSVKKRASVSENAHDVLGTSDTTGSARQGGDNESKKGNPIIVSQPHRSEKNKKTADKKSKKKKSGKNRN